MRDACVRHGWPISPSFSISNQFTRAFHVFPIEKTQWMFCVFFFRLKWIFCCFIDIIYLVGQTNDIRFFIVIAIYIEKPPHYLVSLFLGDTCCGCMRETANAPNHNRNLFIYWHTRNMRRVFSPVKNLPPSDWSNSIRQSFKPYSTWLHIACNNAENRFELKTLHTNWTEPKH